MNFENNQVWISKEYPERDIIINDIWYNDEIHNKNTMRCTWTIYNEKEWDKFVCNKLNVKSIDEAIDKRNCGTYPYAYTGDKNYYNMKQYITKYNMKLMVE